MAETAADLKADGVLGKYAKIYSITHAPLERVLKNVSCSALVRLRHCMNPTVEPSPQPLRFTQSLAALLDGRGWGLGGECRTLPRRLRRILHTGRRCLGAAASWRPCTSSILTLSLTLPRYASSRAHGVRSRVPISGIVQLGA